MTDYWKSIRKDRWAPVREDFDPLDIGPILQHVFRFLSSMRLTMVCLSAAMILVFAGTIAQDLEETLADSAAADEDEAMFKTLLAYSPLHNIKEGVAYPPTLVVTADTDDRVVPGHSFKFISALQQAHKGDAPVMIRIETKAGHGAGKPTSKQIEEVADEWSFLAKNLGLELPERR